PGFPRTEPAAPDAVEGRGIALDPDGALWLAATLTAAPATWGGTIQRLYKYDPVADPLPVATGEVKIAGPGGAVLNPRRGEVLTVYALPPEPGDVTVRVLSLRGEVVRAWTLPSSGNRLLTVAW